MAPALGMWDARTPPSSPGLAGSDSILADSPPRAQSPIYDGARDLLKKERELLDSREREEARRYAAEEEDYWRRADEMDEALTTNDHSVVQSYLPAEPQQSASARLCAPPAVEQPAGAPAPEAAIVVSSLATLGYRRRSPVVREPRAPPRVGPSRASTSRSTTGAARPT